jgi:hypothetical protein
MQAIYGRSSLNNVVYDGYLDGLRKHDARPLHPIVVPRDTSPRMMRKMMFEHQLLEERALHEFSAGKGDGAGVDTGSAPNAPAAAPAPAGLPVASTASIIVAGSFLDGTYYRVPQGTEIMNSAGTVDGPFVLNGGTYMYRMPDSSYDPESPPNLNFFAPGSIIRSAGGEGDAVVSTPFPTWTFSALFFDEVGGPGDAGYWYSWPGERSTHPSTDPNYLPTTGWTGHYTNFTIVAG